MIITYDNLIKQETETKLGDKEFTKKEGSYLFTAEPKIKTYNQEDLEKCLSKIVTK